ncbi:MAG: CpaF family protein [Longimicrobiales bacterium]
MPEWRINKSPSAAPSSGNGEGRTGQETAVREFLPVSRVTATDDKANLHQLRANIHRQLLERLNLSNLDKMDRAEVNRVIGGVVRDLLEGEGIPLNVEERDQLTSQVLDEIFGLGPLQPLMEDQSISDILVDTYARVLVERDGKLYDTDVRFQDDRHLLKVIDRIVSSVGRRIDDASPMVDARLADGSRVNAVIPPLAVDGPHLSIRKFKTDVLSAEDLIRMGTLSEALVELMRGVVQSRLNVLISGGTGAGKTTLLNVLSSFIPGSERIVTVEDSAELQLRQPRVVRLETRPANLEGQGAVNQRALVINALRMRPDRIVVGEVRSSEAIDMLQAMNTGHDGSLTTLHSNSPRDALNRLETMVAMANLNLPERAVRQQIASAVHVVVQLARFSDGKRRLTCLSEIVGMEGEVITMQDVFRFEQEGVREDGEVIGRLRPTGIRPKFADRLKANGVHLPASMFSDLHRASA